MTARKNLPRKQWDELTACLKMENSDERRDPGQI